MPAPQDTAARSVRRAPWLVLASLTAGLLCGAQIAAFHDVRQDDPFITYRYGQNLAEGHGLVFNPGERFLGATSPGHMLVAALVYRLQGRARTPALMAALGCVGWSAQAVAAFALLSPALGALGAGALALLLDLGAARSFMWVPFETNLMAAFALAALAAAQRERWSLAALWAALACLFRPDALLLAAIVLGFCAWEQRARALRPLLVLVGCGLPWVAFATRYYGTPMPHSAVEKFQRTPLPQYLTHTLLHVGQTVFPFADARFFWAAPAWLLAVAGAVALARRERKLAMLGLYGAAQLLAYQVMRPFAGHDWHLYPIALVAVLCSGGGLALLALHARRLWARAGAAAVLSGLLLLAAARTAIASRDYAHGHWTGRRDAAYRRIARFLRDRARPGEQFASIEVGTLAYYSGLSAYDLGGIVTDLERTALISRPVRYLVLDTKYITHAPPWPPLFSAADGDFKAFVYYLPRVPGGL